MEYVLAASAFCLGCVLATLYLMAHVLKANSLSVEFVTNKLRESSDNMEVATKEFAVITDQASKANLTLGKAVADFDKRIQEVENRMNMLNLRVTSKG